MRAIDALRTTLQEILKEKGLPWPEKAVVAPPKDPRHGDLAVNVAMLLAKEAGKNPRALAQELADALPAHCADVAGAEVAGPGFINVTFSPSFWQRVVTDIDAAGDSYGNCNVGQGKKTLLEYVSANPTGPLHVGHGRGAAVGDSVARLLRRAGYDVSTEYYINDAGRQMRILGLSVWLRVQELAGRPVEWPKDFYRGGYIIDIARAMLDEDPSLPDMPEEEGRERCYQRAMNDILDGIKADLRDFRVEHQHWFSEKTLVEGGKVDAAFKALDKAGHTYEEDGAYWFATTELGDDKNRVLRKSDGSLTYFASDIAYHHDKFRRGYEWLIDVWGADHHGYIPRMRAAITAMGEQQESFDVILIQLVNLLQNGKPVSMSTRAGTFETLADVVREVGADAARFMFLSRKSDSSLDFDLELAKQRSLDNPVYYVQYAHARICAVLRRAGERGVSLPETLTPADLAPLDTPEDIALLRKASTLEDVVASAAQSLGVHHISRYLTELAGILHSYYAKHQVLLPDDAPRTIARLALLRSMGQVLRNALDILGVSAPETM